MRATILTGAIDDYGANRVLLQDVAALRGLGAEVRVLAPPEAILSQDQVGRLAAAGATVEPHPLHAFRRVDLRRSLRPPARLPDAARAADLVVVHTVAVAAYLPLLRARGIPSVLAAHELLGGFSGRVFGRLGSLADAVVANSHATARSLRSAGVATERTTVVYPSLPHPRAARRADDSRLRVLLAGRVNGSKGQGDAARAVRAVRAEGVPAELVLAGGPFPGQEARLRELGREIAADPAIRYLGDRSGIGDLLAACNLLLIASRTPESFGFVALEAWCAGRRAMAPCEGGALEAMRLVEGLTFEPRSAPALSRQLLRLWENRRLLQPPSRNAPAAELCSPQRRLDGWAQVLKRARPVR